ncbi:helix-turn-helix domain-containing protein [Streptomyces sp.]|uniref:helix-turn-helix domain-containing protein n=1 Tax=Streptomyces sp. TaxID=1931 RepID=UPI002F950108
MTLIDSHAAAVAVGVTVRTIQRWVRSGRLVNYGRGNAILVDLDTLRSAVDAE